MDLPLLNYSFSKTKDFTSRLLVLFILLNLGEAILFSQEVLDNIYGGVDDTVNVLDWNQKSMIPSIINTRSLLSYDFILLNRYSNRPRLEIVFQTCTYAYSYILVLNSEIIYLASINENPNPTNVFWTCRINDVFFETIKTKLKANTHFTKFNEDTLDYCESYLTKPYIIRKKCYGYSQNFYKKSNMDIKKVFCWLNEMLPHNQEIQIPYKISINKRYPIIIGSLEELQPIPKNKYLQVNYQ